jgi:phenylacetate-coenzyme A ligase PaaK-like adenylate-forming protein
MENTEPCPCKSGKTLGECCGPVIAGTAKAETAEALMRARYASYVTGDVEFLKLADSIAKKVKSVIGFTPLVKVVEVGVLPRSEKKTKRVIDERYD